MNMRKTLALGASAIVFGALHTTPVFAQDEPAADDNHRLQTVTVTSTKRETTLQDIPVAVSVVDATVIEQAEIIDLGDLQALVPSLRVDTFQSSAQTSFRIRGFGNGDNNAGVEPSVGVFIDGVYRSRSAASISDLPNLERVEVLRGPQSTLFGKNASAGVISIVTQAPQFQQEANIEASIGNYNLFRLAGDITGPISDTVAYSFAAHMNQRDGYVDDLALGEDLNQRDRWGVRGQLLIEPNDDLSVRLIADYDQMEELCCATANVTNGPTGAAIFALGGALIPNSPFAGESYSNFAPTNDIENYGVSGQVDYDLGFADFTSITSYRVSDFAQNTDGDFTSADLIGEFYTGTEIETFTQEVRLASSGGENFDWMIGGFYFDETVEIDASLLYGEDLRGYADILSGGGYGQVEALLGFPVGTTFGQAGQGMTEAYGQDNQSWSIFGTVDAYVTDRLTVTVGMNYTSDEKDAYADAVSTDIFSSLDFVSIGNTVIYQTALAQTLALYGVDATNSAQVAAFAGANPAAFAQIQAGSQAYADANDTNENVNALLGLQALQFFPPFVGYPNVVENGSSSDDAFTYSFRASYDMSENVNIYASVATGFKATSWNLSRDSRPTSDDIPALVNAGLGVPNLTAGTRFAGPEDSTVYEIGLKAQFDNVAFNVALFDQTIEGFQSNSFTGTGFALTNAGVQSTEGVEMDVTWSPLDGLTLVAAGTFLDPIYEEFVNSPVGDISGERPQSISDTYLSLSAAYDFVLPNEWYAFVRGDYQYESDTNLSYYPDDSAQERSINVFNASAGFETEGGIRVAVWGRNIFDDEFLIETFPSVAQEGSTTGYPNQPATYGITVSKSF
ncbi:TonB-dependent receptor [Ponticaulis sp.]|uniref:TonB-dependent receptor n=1 Tax=Ponticaulis sp. TaxID=2020902 RepID=UPI0025E9262A|nr:TonB-dependent receptor [Ponticaulis sp.]|tara:strand:+ start:38152 stop:40698 length:2547 start_codon:yes stop_codon:yes gene_type:complete